MKHSPDHEWAAVCLYPGCRAGWEHLPSAEIDIQDRPSAGRFPYRATWEPSSYWWPQTEVPEPVTVIGVSAKAFGGGSVRPCLVAVTDEGRYVSDEPEAFTAPESAATPAPAEGREAVGSLAPAERHAIDAILDRPYADPDDDAAIVARAAQRLAEGREAVREAEGPSRFDVLDDLLDALPIDALEQVISQQADGWSDSVREWLARYAREYAALARTGGSTDGE